MMLKTAQVAALVWIQLLLSWVGGWAHAHRPSLLGDRRTAPCDPVVQRNGPARLCSARAAATPQQPSGSGRARRVTVAIIHSSPWSRKARMAWASMSGDPGRLPPAAMLLTSACNHSPPWRRRAHRPMTVHLTIVIPAMPLQRALVMVIVTLLSEESLTRI